MPEPERWRRLTAKEMLVVRQVIGGATNREVAETLRLSPNTIGAHLGNAFAKLGINSRQELRDLAHELPPEA